MNFYCNSGGTIFHVDPERIFQGSAGVNTIRFIGRFPSSAQVLMAYQLPNGNLTSPKLLALVDELSEVEAPNNGGKFSVWETVLGAVPRLDENGKVLKDDNGNIVYDLDYTITENYGTATLQFYVYAASNPITVNGQVYNVKGGLLATASSYFTIEKGVPALIPTVEELTSSDAQILLAEILNVVASANIAGLNKAVEDANALVKEVEEKLESGAFNGAQGIQGPVGPQGPAGKDGALKLIPVNELPTEDIDETAMYLLRIAETGNRFQTYMYIEGDWEPFEQIELTADLTEYVKFTDLATSYKAGVSCVDPDFQSTYGGIFMSTLGNKKLIIRKAYYADIDKRAATDYIDGGANGVNRCAPIVPANLDYAVMSALANSKDTDGTIWTDDTIAEDGTVTTGTKTKARELLGAVEKAYVNNLPDNLTLDETAQKAWRDMIGASGSDIRTITQEEYDSLETPEEGVTYILIDGDEYRRYTHAIAINESLFLTLETTDKTPYTSFYDNGDHMLARALHSKGYRGKWLLCPASGVEQSSSILYITYGVYVAADDAGVFDYTKLVKCYYYINLESGTFGTGEASVSLSDLDADTPAVEDAVSDI